jgi:hypothetical protein
MRRSQCITISASKQAQQLAKLNISFLSTKTVISFLIEIFRCFEALSTPFHAANAMHADFSVETSTATRKTQSFLDFDENCYFVPDWDISAFKRSFHSILCGERTAYRFQRRNKPSNSQNSISPRIGRKLVISFLIEIFRRLYALSTPFYAANAVHTDFSVETSPATRKTQSFLAFDDTCYFVPDWYILSSKRSFHSILCGERSAYRFQRRNKPSNSQNSILPRFRRNLLFRSWLRYFVVLTLFSLHFTRQQQFMPNSSSKQAVRLAKLNLSLIWKKTCYFVPDWDISEFNRSFHSILCGERSAYRFQRRKKPSNSQNSIFLRIRR